MMTDTTDPIAIPADGPLAAPARLTAEHRADFRRAVLFALEMAAARRARVVEIDLAPTVEMDASGLGVLVLLQRRAQERGLKVRLLDAPHSVRQALAATRLEGLFELERR